MKRLWILGIIAISLHGLFHERTANSQTLSEDMKSDVLITDGFIRDPNTKLEFSKVYGISGAKDTIEYNYNSQHVRMSPNGKFLLYNNYVIPLEDGELIKLVDFPALRSVWSPDGEKIAFYSDGIWVIPVSPETGRPTGPARELLDGGYMFQFNVQWSPDSEKIVFWTTDQYLSVLSISNGKVTQITRDAQYYVPGEWSPDGRWIAFSQARNSIWVVPSEGGQARKLAETDGRVIARWSSDGKWVFYQRNHKLCFIRVSDATSFDITLPKEVGYYVSRTKDGKKMLFYKCSYKWTDSLKVVSSSGGESFGPRGLDLSAIEHHWSADSKLIVSWGWNANKDTYWIIPLTGDNPFPLHLEASMQGSIKCESLSPDLTKILFSQQIPQEKKQYWVIPVALRQGKTTGLPTKIFDKGEVKNFDWAPDGSKLAFLYQDDLWMVRADGTAPVQLTGVSDRRVVRRTWSPDGSAIAWITHLPSSGQSILRMRRLSKDASRDIAETRRYIGFKWSTYGSYITYEFFDRKKGTKREVFVVSTSEGEPKKLIEISQESMRDGAWSPDEEKLAVLAERKLLIFKMPGGESYQVGELLDPRWDACYGMRWSPDGRKIALSMTSNQKSSDQRSIFTVTVPEGKWKELTGKPGTHYFLSWSPDGKWISYDSEEFVKTRPEGILWEVEIDAFLKRMARKTSGDSGPSLD